MKSEESGQLNRALVDTLAGAIAGGISRTVTSPLDVIKIRFQVQLEPTTTWTLLQKEMYRPSKYRGILQTTKEIFREEGLLGFWRGNVPGLFLYMPYTAIQFTVLHKFKTFASGSSKAEDHLQLSQYWSYLSGGFAGCVATVGSYPFDLLRTILASQGEPKMPQLSRLLLLCISRTDPLDGLTYTNYILVYPNMRSAFIAIIQKRGFKGLYAGLSPTLVEIIPYAGLQFGSYDTFKRWMILWNKYRNPDFNPAMTAESVSSFQLFLCGLFAGTFAKSVCHPLDVVKKRFQVEGLQRHPKYGARIENSTYKGMYHALKEILIREGFTGLYKGIIPSLIKSAPAGAVTFLAYEHISDFLELILT